MNNNDNSDDTLNKDSNNNNNSLNNEINTMKFSVDISYKHDNQIVNLSPIDIPLNVRLSNDKQWSSSELLEKCNFDMFILLILKVNVDTLLYS